MSHTPKRLVVQVIDVINGLGYGEDVARLIDWSDYDDGYAIAVDLDAIALSMSESLLDAMPDGLWVEPINCESLRVYPR